MCLHLDDCRNSEETLDGISNILYGFKGTSEIENLRARLPDIARTWGFVVSSWGYVGPSGNYVGECWSYVGPSCSHEGRGLASYGIKLRIEVPIFCGAAATAANGCWLLLLLAAACLLLAAGW